MASAAKVLRNQPALRQQRRLLVAHLCARDEASAADRENAFTSFGRSLAPRYDCRHSSVTLGTRIFAAVYVYARSGLLVDVCLRNMRC